MGADCSLRFKSTNPETFSISVWKKDGETQEFDCTMDSEFTIKFYFPGEYIVSIMPSEPVELWDSPFSNLTVDGISDFCWLVLSFASYFKTQIRILDARPNPIFMLKRSLE